MRLCEPRKPFRLSISKKHAKRASCADPYKCVIAQSLADCPGVIGAEVNATITTVFRRGRCERYQTPSVLRGGLERFDISGKWELEEGIYHLMPVPPSQTKRAVRERAATREEAREAAKLKRYPRRKRPLSPRTINARQLAQLAA